jgi:hypothetical protein
MLARSSIPGLPLNGYAEPEHSHGSHENQVEQADDAERDHLARDQLTGSERAHAELLECADLALTHDGE